MKETIDCLFIGHNEVKFPAYEMLVRMLGIDSGAYRDLSLNFIRYKNKPFSLPDIYNELASPKQPLRLTDVFNPAIAYLGTYLKRAGFTVDFVNSFQDEKERLKELLTTRNILCIAITTTFYVSLYPTAEIISFIRNHNSTVKTIVGGPFIFTQSLNGFSQGFLPSIGADYIISSTQGEKTLTRLLHALKSNASVEQIQNLSYQKNGQWKTNPAIPENNRLEDNIPDWNIFSRHVDTYAYVRTALSCPFSCSFCGFHVRQGKYQVLPVEAIEKELNALEALGTVKSICFVDDTYNFPPRRFKEVLRMIIRNKYSFNWSCQFRCQYADREMVELMKASRCEGVFLGIESANNQILKNMNKKATSDQYKRGISLLNEFGIPGHANFVIGFPGETRQTIQDNIDFIDETCPTFFRTQLWYYEYAAPIYENRNKYNIKGAGFDWSHSTMNSREAFDIIDEIFLKNMNSVWMPQYNFEIYGVYRLLHRGMGLEQIKKFLTAFNQGIREKLTQPQNAEVSEDLINKMKDQVNKT